MRRSTLGAVSGAATVLVLLVGGPADAGPPPAHDHPVPTPAAPAHDHSGGHAHGGAAGDDASTPSGAGVSGSTRAAVLGGFGAVNAIALGGALVLRRRTPSARRTRDRR